MVTGIKEGVRFENAGGRIARFFLRQGSSIKRDGIRACARKALILLSLFLSVVPVLVMRALRPIVLIRLGGLRSDRIGHFAIELEVYLCERDAGMYGKRGVDIFYHAPQVCNRQLKKMVDKTVWVSRFARWPDRLNRWIPGGEKHVIPRRNKWAPYDIHGVMHETPPHLSFTSGEETLGWKELRNMGIPEGAPFACFIARDSVYLNAAFPDQDWSYHDYRNADVLNYFPALKELNDQGYFAVRMGAPEQVPLTSPNPMIIDYATTCRSDFLDIFLGAKCRFFISTGTGIDSVPMIFRRPIVFTNFAPLGTMWSWGQDYLIIPKKLWLRKEKRYSTIREAFETGAAWFHRSDQFEQLGVEVIENTPEEITAVTMEMDQRIKRTWQTTKEDEELQIRFWSHYPQSELHSIMRARIGSGFLRENSALLD